MSNQSFQDDLLAISSETCFPDNDEEAKQLLSRWSDTGISAPKAVLLPRTEDDVLKVIDLASQHSLQVLPAGGKCASFVPIHSGTIYLDMKHFKSASIDRAQGTITVGGGVSTGEAMAVCGEAGYYTLLPNLNAVGVVGAALGGGSSPLNGLHGFAVDNLVSIRILTSNGKAQTLDHHSQGSEAHLFRALLGAGQGLGIITSMTLKAWPLSQLHLTDNKIWTRRLVYPSAAIDQSAEIFCQLKPHKALSTTLLCARLPGKPPSIILSAAFLGPTVEAKKAAASLLSDEAERLALIAETSSVEYHKMNDARNAFGQPRQQKELYTCMVQNVDKQSITSAVKKYITFTEEVEDARRSAILIASWSTESLLANVPKHGQDFVAVRDRGYLVQAIPWYSNSTHKDAAQQFGLEVVEIMREKDLADNLPNRILANNPYFGQNMNYAYTKDMIRNYLHVKQHWDPANIFWSPLTDSEHFTI